MGSSLPGGRLTLVSGQPEMPQTADYTSATLYYAPFISDTIPLFDGTAWISHKFTASDFDTVGLSMAGGAAWTAGSKRDVFVTLVDGLPVLCTGPAWIADDTASRGLVRRNGLWVNAASMACDVGIVVAANQATWVGSINIGATPGTLNATFTLGQQRRCDVWNAYNQREILLGVGQPPVSGALVQWKPSNQYPAYQAFNNNPDNCGHYFTGLPQNIECRYNQRGFVDSLNYGICAALVTICKDTIPNAVGWLSAFTADDSASANGVAMQALFEDRSSVGAHKVFMTAANANGTDGITLWGMYPAGTPQGSAQTMWIKYQG